MHRIVCPLVFAVATAALVGCGPTDKELATMDLPALRQVAEQGEAKAQFILGTVYANGKEVPQNYKQAVAWYQKAAEQGHASAQYDLGQMYTRGWNMGAAMRFWKHLSVNVFTREFTCVSAGLRYECTLMH
jgi:TPR repeat protein